MSAHKEDRLKKVIEAIPPGYMVDNGWLERINRGVFLRLAPNAKKSATIDWKTCLLSMQHIMRCDIHVGGPTALTQQGYDHYLRLGSSAPVWVYGNATPNWLCKPPQARCGSAI